MPKKQTNYFYEKYDDSIENNTNPMIYLTLSTLLMTLIISFAWVLGVIIGG